MENAPLQWKMWGRDLKVIAREMHDMLQGFRVLLGPGRNLVAQPYHQSYVIIFMVDYHHLSMTRFRQNSTLNIVVATPGLRILLGLIANM